MNIACYISDEVSMSYFTNTFFMVLRCIEYTEDSCGDIAVIFW